MSEVSETEKSDIEEAGLTLLVGSFKDFVDSVLLLRETPEDGSTIENIERKLWIKAADQQIGITVAEHKQYIPQFTCYYEGYLNDQAESIKEMNTKEVCDLWKTQPEDALLAVGHYIERTGFHEIKKKMQKAINSVAKLRTNRIFVISGKRASGKSVLARQLLSVAYNEFDQPSLMLSPNASYINSVEEMDRNLTTSGWDARLIDKFLSSFYDDINQEDKSVVPVFLADHSVHRLGALDYLINYLENHGKPCLVILTLNDNEYEELSSNNPIERLLKLFEHDHIPIGHKLDDDEIHALFDVISKLDQRVYDNRNILIHRAISPESCDRDVLLILYTWFDRQFRRLEEIIASQIEALNEEPELRDIYLSVAVFHQFNISPSVSICAEAVGLTIEKFTSIRGLPIFKALINVNNILPSPGSELISTRHAEFSRRILNSVMPDSDSQVKLMSRILACCGPKQVEFVRSVLNYLFRYNAILTVEQVTFLKEATEINLKKDYVLNHQFASYLIRERTQLDTARYYLDLALTEYENNSSVLHSLGNLCYNLYKMNYEIDPTKANQYFDDAKSYFARSRALNGTKEEHGYFTDIDMTRHMVNSFHLTDKKKALLMAEQHALTLEALRVIPFERQNLLRQSLGGEVHFRDIPQKDRDIIKQEVMSGKASPLLLEYYSSDLLSSPKAKNWKRLSDLILKYWDIAINQAQTAIIIALIAKKGFIKNASTRFELLRPFYDNLVRHRSTQINFVLLAEYVRLIQVDAFILGKFSFLRSAMGDVVDLYRDSKPRFLSDEYILDSKYYNFDENNTQELIHIFEDSIDFSRSVYAERFNRLVQVPNEDGTRYFTVQMDPIDHFFIKALKKETAMRGRVELSFNVKQTFDGFMATNFRS